MILEHCYEYQGNEMHSVRAAQSQLARPKWWVSSGIVREGFLEEMTIEFSFNVGSNLKGEGSSKYLEWIKGIFKQKLPKEHTVFSHPSSKLGA